MVKAYWWNFGKKTLDFEGTIKDCLKSKSIKFRKFKDKKCPEVERWRFTTCHNVVYKHTGSFEEGAFVILKLWYATMGDKSRLDFNSRVFTNNFHR